MRLGSASTTVTGTASPPSVKMRVMPHLRPTRPMAMSILVSCRRSGLRFNQGAAVWVLETPEPSAESLLDLLGQLASEPTRSGPGKRPRSIPEKAGSASARRAREAQGLAEAWPHGCSEPQAARADGA